MLKIALASPPVAGSIDRALPWVAKFIGQAAEQRADIVCFPESYIPGLRGQGFHVEAHDPAGLRDARASVCRLAETHGITVIMPMDWDSPEGILNAAFVISPQGEVLGSQTKNQLAPEEDEFYVPGTTRQLFEVKGVRFGIAICHEGWRYPETVRWAATRGAQIVFHPTLTGSDSSGQRPGAEDAQESSFYENAMVCRSMENTVFFASANHALKFQESATAVISPDGECTARLPYGEPGVLVTEIDPAAATGLYASRFAPKTY
jgi:5-aminopentanamidase